MRALVCGGREYRNRQFLHKVLDTINPTEIIHGGATGADTLAGEYARRRGIPCTAYPPDRSLDGPGRDWKFNRNARMLHTSRPDLVVAFPGGPGTAHMVRTARKAGYKVRQFAPEAQPNPRPPNEKKPTMTTKTVPVSEIPGWNSTRA